MTFSCNRGIISIIVDGSARPGIPEKAETGQMGQGRNRKKGRRAPEQEEYPLLLRSLLSGDLRSAFITLALSLPAIVLCLSVHEAAHGGVACLLGDRTARDSGRLTLSPMAHIDPVGFLCLLLFGFGWARPVPVNISNFKNRRTGMAATALAGPVANFVTAFVAYCLYFLVWIYGDSVFMQVVGEFLRPWRACRLALVCST